MKKCISKGAKLYNNSNYYYYYYCCYCCYKINNNNQKKEFEKNICNVMKGKLFGTISVALLTNIL